MRAVPIDALAVEEESGCSYPEPFRARMGKTTWRALGDRFGLTQFGASLDTIPPGGQSSLRHWHTGEDELVYVLEGELVLRVNDCEHVLRAGMCAGFKAGDDDAHHLVNRSSAVARFLVIGSRVDGDRGHYPDDDLEWGHGEGGRRVALHKDGSPYP